MAANKRQHYVPQWLLRQFSPDGRSITVFHMSTGRILPGAALSTQCCRDYFYGRDGKMERLFAELEGRVSRTVERIKECHLDQISDRDILELRTFVHFQLYRTEGAAARASELAVDVAREAPGDDGEQVPEGVLEFANPQLACLEQALETSVVTGDLGIKLIVAGRRLRFLLSDHPVVLYNEFGEKSSVLRRWPCRTGLAARGLQIFMPLTPELCLALYDDQVYRYGSDKIIACAAGDRDVRTLNLLQALSATSCLYVSGEPDPVALRALATERDRLNLATRPTVWRGPEQDWADGTSSQLIAYRDVSPNLGIGLNFVQVIDRTDYSRYPYASFPVRDREMLKLLHQKPFSEWLREAEAEFGSTGSARETSEGEVKDLDVEATAADAVGSDARSARSNPDTTARRT
jgi:hypothetical protein